MEEFVTPPFKEAVNDYLFLKSKEYPEKAAIKLVGDRYRLTGIQRMILFRGIASPGTATGRQSKITGDITGKKLYVDGYNVLFTIMNYLLGKVIFKAFDGILRDAGAGYGKIEKEGFLYKAMDILFQWPGSSEAESMTIYLDRSISNSDAHAKELERRMNRAHISGQVIPVQFADKELKQKRDAVIATSDSEIIDAVPCRILDAARHALESKYGDRIKILDLKYLIKDPADLL